ncbi:LOW QUALITY PROTEIN: TOX high mobility group box family member 4-like [Myiozetetes cayanensis]|uniref:LOW QUALITY PROTEIN: TOX high mobility group box family member 4-like n=1 Tax=Myiozetetes cayanensis TaxID=478635 RepID=UPI00215E9EBF|nr:LOW QUALITY PROTEIN: TOX high mobility group box family member 4-like [Myiozetetes cayanensis]
MEFPGGSDNYLAITGAAHPFLSGAETFHTPSLGDEEFEIPPIPLESDPSLAVVGHFEDLAEPGGPPEPPFAPPYGVGGLELPVGLPPGIIEQSGGLLNMELEHPMASQFGRLPVTIEVPMGALSRGLLDLGALTTIDQSELSSQLGLSLGGPAPATPAPATPAQATPGADPEPALSPGPSPHAAASPQDDEGDEFRRVRLLNRPDYPEIGPSYPKINPSYHKINRNYPKLPPPRGRRLIAVPAPAGPPQRRAAGRLPAEPARRPKPPKKAKKKKDPNEPQKPVSAYALFFRDTQAAIKGQNPNATFGEVSKIIVASMWDSLGEEQKQVYKRKTEAAKKEYLKALTAYRATLTSSEPPSRSPAPLPSPNNPSTLSLSNLEIHDFCCQVESPPGVEVLGGSPGRAGSPRCRCVRAGCANAPVPSPDWDLEFCSSDCVVRHCRDVFLAWLAARNAGNSVVFVK